MTDPTEAIRERVSQAERDALLDLPHVFGHGIGLTYQNSEETGEVGIVVHVDEKVDPSDLDEDERVPEEINGVQTDVVERERPTPTVDDSDSGVKGRRRHYQDPIGPGHALSYVTSDGNSGWAGSLGYVLEDNDGDAVGLTNDHVVRDGDTGEFYPSFGWSDDEFATVKEGGNTADGGGSEVDDVATIAWNDNPPYQPSSTLFALADTGRPITPVVGEFYLLTGARTGYHSFRCTAVDITFEILYSYNESQATVTGVAEYENYDFDRAGGNSGSAIGHLDRNGVFHPTSLQFAGGIDYTYGILFDDIVERLSTVDSIEPHPNTGATTLQDSPSGSPRLEVAVNGIDYRPDSNEFAIDVIYSSTGDEAISGSVELRESGGTVLDSIDVNMDPIEWGRTSFTVANSYEGQDLVLASTSSQTAGSYPATESQTFNILVNDGVHPEITGTNEPVLEGEILTVDFVVENTGSEEETLDVELRVE